jgi:hypothetical protein
MAVASVAAPAVVVAEGSVRRSSRARVELDYREPSLHSKVRKGHVFFQPKPSSGSK